jgi:hypothetical protein
MRHSMCFPLAAAAAGSPAARGQRSRARACGEVQSYALRRDRQSIARLRRATSSDQPELTS